MEQKDKEMAELLSCTYQRQYHHNTYPELSDNSEFVTSKEEIKEACMQMAEWKEKQMIAFIDDEVNLIDTCLLKKAETKEMLYRYEGIIDGLLRVKNKIINK